MSSDEHQQHAWIAIAAILDVSPDDAETRREIRMAADAWQNFGIDDFATSVDLRDDLKQIAAMSRQLATKSERVRNHVQMQLLLHHNGMPISHDDLDNPFANEHLQAMRLIGNLCDGLAATMRTARGPKGDVPRRAAWLRATEIYEKTTGKNATFSRNAEQQICGRWVEFIRNFCAYVVPDFKPEDGAIEAFHKQRGRVLKAGGNPLMEVYFGG